MAEESVNSQALFIEVSPMMPGASQFTITARPPRQPENEQDMVSIKLESEETQEVKETFLKEIMGISDAEDEPANPKSGEKVRCDECHFTTTDTDRLLRHVRRVHRGLNPFQCYMCDYSTYNKVLFEEHVRIHRGIKPFKCSYCDYCSASKKNTKKHELIHRPDNPLRCPHCPFIARHPRALLCHRKTHTGSDAEDDDKKEVEQAKIAKCELCCDSFKTTKAFFNHRRRRRRCHEPDCNAVMCTMLAYTNHMSNMHQKHKEKPKFFQCEVCDYSANTRPRMLLHLIHHPNQNVDENQLDISILRKYGIMV